MVPAAGEEVVACVVVTRAPGGGYLLRYTIEGRELLDGASLVAGRFAPDVDEVLALGAVMVRCDRAAVAAVRARA